MAPKVTIKLDGIEGALAQFNKFDKESRVAMRKVVKKSATRLRKAIVSRAPLGPTGNLKKSITASYASDGFSAKVGPKSGKGGSHAHLVEFGHMVVVGGQLRGHSPAKPFIVPSAEEESPKYLKDVKDGIKGAIPK